MKQGERPIPRRAMATSAAWALPTMVVAAAAPAMAASPTAGTVSTTATATPQFNSYPAGGRFDATAPWSLAGYSTLIPAGTHITGITVKVRYRGGYQTVQSGSSTQQLSLTQKFTTSIIPAVVADQTVIVERSLTGTSSITLPVLGTGPDPLVYTTATIPSDQWSAYANAISGSVETSGTTSIPTAPGGFQYGVDFTIVIDATYSYAPN